MNNVKTKYRIQCALALFVLYNLCVCVIATSENEHYEIPQPKFKLLKPKGFQVSIPDEEGLQLFAFHGNLNKKMEKMSNGQFQMDIIDKVNGRWIYQNRKLKIRAGDVIYFWMFAIKNRVGYTYEDGMYEVQESDTKRVSKKSHNLKKRFAHLQYKSYGTYAPGFNRNQDDEADVGLLGLNDDSNEDLPFGVNHGHGLPRFHTWGYHNRGFPSGHTPEYHGYAAPHRLHRPHGPSHHNFPGHGHHHYHHGSFSDHPHHSWGHKHGHDCGWSDSSEESGSHNDETTEKTETETIGNSSDDLPITSSIPSTTVKVIPEPEPEAELIQTTTSEPQIDLRFGAKNK